ncbi:MAG: glycosyltransferase family 2 protein [Candidatus Bathyarchaeia archaeon]
MLESGPPRSIPPKDRVISRLLSSRPVRKDDVTIVVPVLNEEGAIGMVLDEIFSNGYRHILVVDGYSKDNTVQIAKSKGANVAQQHGMGKTGAIKTAIDLVPTPYMLLMDGDYTYAAADIEKFLDHAHNYDQIVGVRSRKNISRLHKLGNEVISKCFNLMFDTALSDVCSGMYLLKTEAAKELDLHSGGFNVDVEIIAQIAVRGEITEVPIEYRDRVGKPKLSTWKNGTQIIYSVLVWSRVYNPVFIFSIIAALALIPGLALLIWVVAMWLLRRVFYSGWALMAAILLFGAGQALTVGSISLLIKRSEARITKRLKEAGSSRY